MYNYFKKYGIFDSEVLKKTHSFISIMHCILYRSMVLYTGMQFGWNKKNIYVRSNLNEHCRKTLS
jgi:hypothetical protein